MRVKTSVNICLCLLIQALCCHSTGFSQAQDRIAAENYNNAQFNKALSLYNNPSDVKNSDEILNMAIILKDAQNYNDAIRIIEQNIPKESMDKKAILLLARLYYLSNRAQEAISILRGEEDLFPQDVDAQIILGLSHKDRGNDESAKMHFERAVQLDKDNILAHISLADIYTRRSKRAEALDEIARAYGLSSAWGRS